MHLNCTKLCCSAFNQFIYFQIEEKINFVDTHSLIISFHGQFTFIEINLFFKFYLGVFNYIMKHSNATIICFM